MIASTRQRATLSRSPGVATRRRELRIIEVKRSELNGLLDRLAQALRYASPNSTVPPAGS